MKKIIELIKLYWNILSWLCVFVIMLPIVKEIGVVKEYSVLTAKEWWVGVLIFSGTWAVGYMAGHNNQKRIKENEKMEMESKDS